MIRVPDSARGGKGQCPKCGIRITVPRKSTIKIDQSPPTPSDQEFQIPGVTDETIAYQSDRSDGLTSTEDSVVMLEPAHPESAGTPVAQSGPLPFIEAPKSTLSRKPPPKSEPQQKKRRRGDSNKMLLIVGAVLMMLLIGMGIAIVAPMMAGKLEGKLVAGTSEQIELPPVLIEQSRIPFDSTELSTLLKKLERSPLPMSSNNMRVELSATSSGLRISIEPSAQSRFYRVATASNEVLQKYLSTHLAKFEEQRAREVELEAGQFFTTYQKVLAKQVSSDSIGTFRDRLALPALVKGLGNRVVAAHGQALYPCVYEDSEGGLYFLLPAGLQSFTLVGREDDASRSIAKLEFSVTVKGEISLPKSLKPQNPQKETSKSDSKDEKSPDESDQMRNGEK